MVHNEHITTVPLQINGVFGINVQTKSDLRGSFTRLWDGINLPIEFKIVQTSYVTNYSSGTLRGLHYQNQPFSETKLIHCISGMVFDVVVDIRSGSETYGKHLSLEIGPNCEFQGLLVPAEFAHGYLTLKPNSNIIYFMDNIYSPTSSDGINWNDKNLAIKWPSVPKLISERDRNFPMLGFE